MKDHVGELIVSAVGLTIATASTVGLVSTGNDGLTVPIVFGGVCGVVFGVVGLCDLWKDREPKRDRNVRERSRGYLETKAKAAQIVGLGEGTGYKNIAQELADSGSSNLQIVVNTGQGRHYTRGAREFLKDVQKETKKLKTKKVMRVKF